MSKRFASAPSTNGRPAGATFIVRNWKRCRTRWWSASTCWRWLASAPTCGTGTAPWFQSLGFDLAGGRDLYRQELEALQNPLVVGFYLLAMAAVGSHLWHGIASSLQSLGFDHPVWTPRIFGAAKLIAFLIAFSFMVIAVWAYLQQGGRVRV